MQARWLGRIGYEEAMALQGELVAARAAGQVGDQLLLLEHDPVYTAGRHADIAEHVLGTTDVRVVATDRGGDVTYHGPGQLVAYPIVRLAEPRDVTSYVRALQDACVRAAASFGVDATGDLQRTGVWVGQDKLVAIGVRIRHGVTSHGLAFNVHPDMTHFAGIVACGLRNAGVCSLAMLGVEAGVEEVADRLQHHLAGSLGQRLAPATFDGGLPQAASGH